MVSNELAGKNDISKVSHWRKNEKPQGHTEKNSMEPYQETLVNIIQGYKWHYILAISVIMHQWKITGKLLKVLMI